MADVFWLSDAQWAVIGPLLPSNQPGARRTDDPLPGNGLPSNRERGRVISGIVHVLKSGCRWQDCPACYGPPTTIYNRFHRWSARGLWQRLFEAVVRLDGTDLHMIDSTSAKAHRSSGGAKGGPISRRLAAHAAAERQKSMLLSIVAAVPSHSN